MNRLGIGLAIIFFLIVFANMFQNYRYTCISAGEHLSVFDKKSGTIYILADKENIVTANLPRGTASVTKLEVSM